MAETRENPLAGGEEALEFRQVTDLPVKTIVHSHGHVFYNFGVEAWFDHAAERVEPRPVVVGHENLPSRTSSWIAANLYRVMAGYPHDRALD